MSKKVIGTTLALTAALAFAVAPVSSAVAGHSSKVMCSGVNACKAKSHCKTATNTCKGQNACKGKGVVSMSKKKCIKKGGAVVTPAKKMEKM